MSEDPYVYPGTHVLINRFDIRDADALDDVERFYAAQRRTEGIPRGDFDLNHLKAIHRHLFQDVYDWAGETRTVHMSKGDSVFQFPQYIEFGVGAVHAKVQNCGYLRDMSREDFAVQAADIIGDLNYAHPFREGNGRTQLYYLEQLGEQAGHVLDIGSLQSEQWLHASIEAHHSNFTPMETAIHGAMSADLTPENKQEPDLEP